ncbi:MAG: hypothetical protein WA091_02335 [Minisyncoccales bacterium]|jgi:hypothetical protein
MQFISHDLLYLIRAILFGFVVAYGIMAFVYYFKPWAEKTFKANKKIDTDVWWWTGVVVAIVAGITSMLLLL